MAKAKKPPVPTGPGECRLCPRWENSKIVCMTGIGPNNPELVIISDVPSLRDETNFATRTPLDSPSGRILRRALEIAGIREERVFFTHTVRCSHGGVSTPGMVQIRKCRPYLLDELSALDYSRCRGVLLVGEIAIRGLLNNGKLTVRATRLRVLDGWGPKDSNDKLIIPVSLRSTFHPDEALPKENPLLADEIEGDLQTTFRIRDALKPTIRTEDAETLTKVYEHSKKLSIDLEWRRDGTIRMVGLSDGKTNCVMLDKAEAFRWISDWSGLKIGLSQ